MPLESRPSVVPSVSVTGGIPSAGAVLIIDDDCLFLASSSPPITSYALVAKLLAPVEFGFVLTAGVARVGFLGTTTDVDSG